MNSSHLLNIYPQILACTVCGPIEFGCVVDMIRVSLVSKYTRYFSDEYDKMYI